MAEPNEDATLSPVASPEVDILVLHRQIAHIRETATSDADRHLGLAHLLVGLTNAAGCVFFTASDDDTQPGKLEIGARIFSRQALAWNENLLQILHQQAEVACQYNTLQIDTLEGNDEAKIFTAPLFPDKQCMGAISLVLALGGQQAETFATILQLFSGLVSFLDPTPAAAVASVDTVVPDIEKLDRLDEAARFIVDMLSREFHCHKVALSVPSLFSKSKLVALSQAESIDKRNEVIHEIRLSMDVAIDSGKAVRWSSGHAATAELSVVAERFDLKDLLVLPLLSYHGRHAGCLLMGWDKPGILSESMLKRITVTSTCIGGSLYSMMHGFHTLLEHWYHRFRAADNFKGRRLTAGLAITFVLAMIWPIDYKISADSLVQPATHRYVVSQFDGILDQVLVDPGDLVQAGQVMAVMDGRELKRRLYGLEADRDKSVKQADMHTVEGNTASAQIARLDAQRIDAQIELINYQLEHLEIRSVIGGQVLLGDLEQQEGAPVERGQKLFEVGSLDKMLVEIAIPADEIRHYVEGMPVEVRLEALPDMEIRQTVRRLHPRATVHESKNVFIAEIEIDNKKKLLRPGMRGKAKLNAGKRMLFWVWLHRPYEKIMGYLFW